MNILWDLFLILFLLMAGCSSTTYTSREDGSELPSFENPWGYANDPVYGDWFTMPYINPYQQ